MRLREQSVAIATLNHVIKQDSILRFFWNTILYS